MKIFVWESHKSQPYVLLKGYKDALVRIDPSPNGKFLLQFRNRCGYADSVEKAKDFVEACAELNSVRAFDC